jgi:hypothetical protein
LSLTPTAQADLKLVNDLPNSSSEASLRLGIVTPLASEEETIDSFLDAVLKHLDSNDRIFCVLDKACKDKTKEKIDAYHSQKDARVILIWAPENRSVVDAYFRGYRAAYEAGCQWILEMDGGFSHSPDIIPQFIEKMKTGVDFAAGSRFMSGGSYSGDLSRHLISRGGTFLANLLLGTRMKDMTSGFECFSRRAMRLVLDRGTKSRGHFFQTEIKFMLRSWNWMEVPIHYKNPSKSVGTNSLKDAFRNLWALFKKADAPAAEAEKKVSCVITTIQRPTDCVKKLGEVLSQSSSSLIVIGDKKGPADFDQKDSQFFSLTQQQDLKFELAKILPVAHYARKNIGYLLAAKKGAPCIYETDDDNMPNEEFKLRSLVVEAESISPRHWVNVYRAFSEQLIWPRGFPLECITAKETFSNIRSGMTVTEICPIQQGLADLSPDVDAVWRLTMDREFSFDKAKSAWLAPGSWCPFNSQTTWWWPVAYPLMYLPSYCSFRMTDIWRSFIAQRCLWELGRGLVFHSPEVVQERNIHILLKDFEGEVPGYTQNESIVRCLENLQLKGGPENVLSNLIKCYEAMIAAGYFPQKEMELVQAWAKDLTN